MAPHGMEFEIKVHDVRLQEWGLPRYHSDFAAGIDLYACLEAPIELAPQAPAVLISSGLAVLMHRPDVAAFVLPRSGLGHKKGLVLGNGTGCIDADYADIVYISAWNRNPPGTRPILVQPGERIAQMVFLPILRPRLTVVDEFTNTTGRGTGGFGSTGL